MNAQLLNQIVNAVLYEGYVLYPYRPSSKKNQRERFTFGRVYPPACSEAQKGREQCVMQTECLLQRPGQGGTLRVSVRFLHPMWREAGKPAMADGKASAGAVAQFQVVPELLVDGQLLQTWQEAVEREVKVPPMPVESGRERVGFSFPASRALTPINASSGRVEAMIIRRQDALEGAVEIEINPLTASVFKVIVRVFNLTPTTPGELRNSDAVQMRTFASTHIILQTTDAEFISLLEPAAEHESLAATCRNIGVWPVLVGEAGQSDAMLASPIILYDYPQIAPESGGDFCDGTEIDEMLALRVLTLTDAEKSEMRAVDGFARRILERAESLPPGQMLRLHGAMRDVRAGEDFFNPRKPVTSVMVNGEELKAGDRVRIRPKNRADAIDMILSGKTAIVEAVEQDAENRIHLAVVLEDDPGRDLGLGRQPGHRFFYSTEEVEPLTTEAVQ